MNSFDKFLIIAFYRNWWDRYEWTEALINLGYKVSGSDLVENQNVLRLKA